jgi:hypothetical protein
LVRFFLEGAEYFISTARLLDELQHFIPVELGYVVFRIVFLRIVGITPSRWRRFEDIARVRSG